MSDKPVMSICINTKDYFSKLADYYRDELEKLKQDPRLSDDSATALAAVMGSTGAVVKLYAIHGKAIFKFGVEGAPGRLGRFITIDTDECEILTANDINTEGE